MERHRFVGGLGFMNFSFKVEGNGMLLFVFLY